tara:strand:- start:2382 stop:2498 length:117 start_codon:yes stop_codon:yes gene_type:complete
MVSFLRDSGAPFRLTYSVANRGNLRQPPRSSDLPKLAQ